MRVVTAGWAVEVVETAATGTVGMAAEQADNAEMTVKLERGVVGVVEEALAMVMQAVVTMAVVKLAVLAVSEVDVEARVA